MSKMMKSRFLGPALLLLTLTMIAGCSKAEKTAAAPPPSVPVSIAAVVRKDVPLVVHAIGNVESYQTVAVKSQVGGELTEVHFKEGEDVQEGQLLFTLDRRQLAAEVTRAESNLVRDEAAARNARIQAERYARLLQEGVVSQQQYDQFLSAADVADAVVAADKAAVEHARLQLQYTKIYSPIAGRTGHLAVDRGNLVKANDNPALVTINQISPIYVSFAIPEKQLSEVKRYLAAGTVKVEAVIPASGAGPETKLGELSFIDNAVDPTTGTIRLKGRFGNGDRKLWPGQFVDVLLALSVTPGAVVVPSQAIQTGQQGQYVFIVNPDMTVDTRNVNTGRSADNETIIESGLEAGDRVVVDGHLRLTKGVRVEEKRLSAVPATPAPAVQGK